MTDRDPLNTKPTWEFGSFNAGPFIYWGFPGHDWHYVVTQPLFAIPITHLVLRPHPTHPGHFIKAFDVLQDAFDWCNLKQDSLHALAKGFAGVFAGEDISKMQHFPTPPDVAAEQEDYEAKVKATLARHEANQARLTAKGFRFHKEPTGNLKDLIADLHPGLEVDLTVEPFPQEEPPDPPEFDVTVTS